MIKQYDFFGGVKMIKNYIFTKLFFPQARIIRFPFDVRGKKYIYWGTQLTTGYGCRIEAYPLNKQDKKVLKFGKDVQLNDYVHITAMRSVIIGNNVLMASKIYISDCTHGSYSLEKSDSPEIPPMQRDYYCKPVRIEDNVWLGEFVSVLPGVTIGKGAIVGANSVVTKDLPPYVIAVGIPAKPIKKYNFETQTWEKL